MNDLTPLDPLLARPMPFTRLLDEAMRLVRRHFRAMFPSVAIPLGLLAAVTGAFQALLVPGLMDGSERVSLGQLGFGCVTYFLVFLQMFIMLIGFTALQKAAMEAMAGRPVDMKAAWRFAIQLPVLGTLFLVGLAYIGAAIACVVPLLYVAPLLSLVGPIMAAEGVFGGRALSRSSELTRYNPQNRFLETPLVKALGLLVVTAVISYAVAFVVVLPFQIPMYIDIFRKAAAGEEAATMSVMSKWLWIQIPSQILQMLSTVAVYTYSSFAFGLLFLDARGRKEGTDLATEINTVFGPGSPAGEPAP